MSKGNCKDCKFSELSKTEPYYDCKESPDTILKLEDDWCGRFEPSLRIEDSKESE